MIFRHRATLVERQVPPHLRGTFELVDGRRDFSGISRITGVT
ncbi:MAG: hypothetical protein AVDCRST_MAG73-844 [uncultured Thermomicrobiales bacterium]|uniref:Uncharacterized protein n=1 Tax=uncultured Thermomicrobiales bacterium TaxID=1645740 RepID=A0A6J4TRG2_9BACT|nr:MAG: hypothetical protein AVDCRST_MAG73-844 [uncultured Thermomicrobiales bacterium]